MKFLRVPVLDDLKTFRKYVTVPVHAGASGRFANLRRLLEAMCLRRTKTLLNLPEPITNTQMLELSASENEVYHDFGESCRHVIDLAVSGHSIKKANHHVIQAVLGMRLFCNDGPSALSRKWFTQGLPSDPDQALSFLQACGRSVCVQCDAEVQTMYQSDDRSSGILTSCQHLICGECLPTYEADLDDISEEGRTQCPICELHGPRDSFLSPPSRSVKTTAADSYPTKLLALLNTVRDQNVTEKW